MKRMLTVPIAVHSREELSRYAQALRRVGAERVFLCSIPHWVDDDLLKSRMEEHGFRFLVFCFDAGSLDFSSLTAWKTNPFSQKIVPSSVWIDKSS